MTTETSIATEIKSSNRVCDLVIETKIRMEDKGIATTLTERSYSLMVEAGFTKNTLLDVFVLAQILVEHGPITVRGAFYRAVSCGIYPGTDQKYYRACSDRILQMRRRHCVSYDKISDSTRRRLKPSSWSGLSDFSETVRSVYRKDFWSRQTFYLEVFCEKDAMAGVIQPVTDEYDVHLNIIRGNASESFVWNIAEQWKEIDKPIRVLYLGDHDPSGLSIEKDLIRRLCDFTGAERLNDSEGKLIQWERLAITEDDLNSGLLSFPIKGDRSSRAWQTKHTAYLEKYGDRCVEVDALPPDIIRQRVRDQIELFIDQEEWEKLKQIEEMEKETIIQTFQNLGKTA